MKKLLSYLVLCLLFAYGNQVNAQSNIYEMSDFSVYQKIHKKIAIIPITITVDIKSFPRDLTVDDMLKLHKDESVFLQDFFFAANLNENRNKRLTAELQDVRKTRMLLENNNINYSNMSKFSYEEISKICDVDALVVVFFYKSSQIVNENSRITVDSKVSIIDKNGKLLWEYYDTVFAGPDKNALYLEKIILEKAAKRLPYRNEIKEPKTN